MPLDDASSQTAGTPEWWLLRLGKKLSAQATSADELNNYDRGAHPLPVGHQRARAAYQRFQRQARTNFVGLVVDAVMDRLSVGGFRMNSVESDQLAQRIWQANGMDAGIKPVLRDALVMRRSYVIVGPDTRKGGRENGSGVLLTGEDPRQVIHASDPVDRRQVRAALKVWVDELDNRDRAVVYLPDGVFYFIGPRRASGDGDLISNESFWSAMRWSIDVNEGDMGVAKNPSAPLVPVVPFVNRLDKDREGFGEFEDVTSIQDRINQVVLDRLVIGAAQSFRQRWATGVQFKDQDGNDIQPWDPGADLLWHTVADDATFGDFAAADLAPIIGAAKADVEQLASITRTPPYYLLGSMVNISGDALTAADTGATAKAEARQDGFGEALEAVQALAFHLLGKEAPVEAETIWVDAERRNEAKSADAAVKKQAVGVPWRQLMEDLGYSPQQIDRMEVERAIEQLRAVSEAAQLAAAAAEAAPGSGEPPGNQGGNSPGAGANGADPNLSNASG